MDLRRFVVSSGIVYAGSIVSVAVQAAFYMMSLRIGIEAFGALQSILAVLFPMFTVRSIIGGYIVIHASGDEYALPSIARKGIAYSFAASLALAGVFIAMAPTLRDFLHLQTSMPFVLIGVACLPSLVQGVMEGVLNVQRRFAAMALTGIVGSLSNLALAAWLFRDGFQEADGGWFVLVGSTFSFVLVSAITFKVFLAKATPAKGSTPKEIGSLLLASILFGGSLRVDVFWARHVLSKEAAGVYALCASVAVVLYLITGSISRVVSVSMRDGENDERSVVRASYVTMAGTAFVLAVGFATFGLPLLRLITGHDVPIDWGTLVPLFIALTCYSAITFDYSCLNVLTKNIHAGIGAILVGSQTAALIAFGYSAHAIAWADCIVMAVLAVVFSDSLLQALRAARKQAVPHPAEHHLAQNA